MAKFKYTMGKKLDLKKEQKATLKRPVMKFNFVLKLLVIAMNLVYGRKRTIAKFKIIELFARYPYCAWESASYRHVSKLHTKRKYAEKADSDREIHVIELGRESQDNEQWHLMIIEDIMRQKGIKLGFLRGILIPRLMTIGYKIFSASLYRIRPAWSFSMNARFESHAEHEYMEIVKENPHWETDRIDTKYFEYYPRQKTMADLFRRIGLDERDHMYQSMEEYKLITGKDLK
ncbi:alternative oxidase [Spirochaetota bacterium]